MTPQQVHEWSNGVHVISTDKTLLDLDLVASFLCDESYWARGIPRETVLRAVEGSVCFGIYLNAEQVGFARVITDLATFAYLCDVFVVEAHRGLGLSKWLMECTLRHPQLQGLRRWLLATHNAHSLYRRYGFKRVARPDNFLELHNPLVYGPRRR